MTCSSERDFDGWRRCRWAGIGCVGRSPKGECRRARCCSLQTGVTQRAGCGRRRFTYRRTNRSDTGPNCQVHSGVEPYTRTTGHECAPSIACLVSPVDIASALTGILDAGVGPTVRMRALSGTGHCLPPLRPRPNLLQERLLRAFAPFQHARGRPALPAQPPWPLCTRRTDAPLSQPPE